MQIKKKKKKKSDALQGREAGKQGGKVAAEYIKSVLRDLGVKPYFADYLQPFESYSPARERHVEFQVHPDSIAKYKQGRFYRRLNLQNVVGYIEGKQKDEYVIVGAHYDHVGVDETLVGDQIYNGAVHWQYYEELNKIQAAKTGLSVTKTLLPSTLHPSPLKVGDKVTIRLTVKSDRDMEYVSLKDMRAGCFEPVNQLSGTQWKQGVVYYLAPKDESTTFFIQALPKGTYHFDYEVYVTRAGDYSSGIATVQCLYAPEFEAHTGGGRVIVE